jgi:TolA-binding protein
VQQMARGLPAAEQASEEQLALVGGALEHVIQAAPGTAGAAQAQMAIASLHARRGAYALAREAYVKAISTYDQFPKVNLQARLMLAKIYGVEQKWTEAAGVYAGIAERYPWSPIGLVSPLYAAQILERHGDAEQASHAYEQAVTQYTDLARHAPTKELEARAQQYADEAKRRAAGTTDQD